MPNFLEPAQAPQGEAGQGNQPRRTTALTGSAQQQEHLCWHKPEGQSSSFSSFSSKELPGSVARGPISGSGWQEPPFPQSLPSCPCPKL